MDNLFKNHRPFQNYILKIQLEFNFLSFSNTDQNAPKKIRAVIILHFIRKMF